jgi:hypothetical protein
MATPTPAHLPTRQQLDEIDALLRRMLTLPPLAGEAGADSTIPPPASVAAPVAVSYPAPTIREIPPTRPPAAGDPVVQEWRAGWPQPPVPQAGSVAAWGSPVPLATPAEVPYHPEPSPVPFYHPSAYFVPPPPTTSQPATNTGAGSPRASPVAALAAAGPPPVSPALWPLIALNVTFNVLTYLLGPLGTWLRGSGRTAMGRLGIGMILAAGVWAAGEWYGYDWPKIDVSAIQAKLRLPR